MNSRERDDEIAALAALDAGRQAATDEVRADDAAETRTAPYECPRCNGHGLVSNVPSLDCPDHEVVCPDCEGYGVVDELVEQDTEIPSCEEAGS